MSGLTDSEHPGLIARTSSAVIAWLLRVRLVRAALRYSSRRGPVLADAVTYRALFSVFAAVLLGFSAAALWLSQDDVAWGAVVQAIDSAVPGLIATAGGQGIVDLDDLPAAGGLSLAGVIALVGLVGSALGAIGSLRTAIRSVAGTESADVAWYWVILRNIALALIIAVTFAGAAALTFAGAVAVDWFAGLVGLPSGSAAAAWMVRIVSALVVLALNAVLIAAAFRMLSGVTASARALWSGALLGGVALLALQELSGLFVGGARANPLLGTFASLLALLIWLNLSTQVILIASAFVVESVHEQRDRVASRFGTPTLQDLTVRFAEEDVRTATAVLRAARDAADGEH
ncbi:YhjD/YihY/BrkB family envelope integrity protein [Microbacterium sp. ARD32]|uniref:YhjD/YihY/BrkB family envelope integrity protein n=1 Tax=Microbacterium sp. ARD32 TaxID=2962577 RepID=UPI002882AF1B|nr:YhjD/YihY/BrkB family envelope integrity protein [Microbacterium sp. ARD32]MDT0156856.1 YhjD/YihY/BrkB family envelope integrity protein [Microbacterium sp. ARD32]